MDPAALWSSIARSRSASSMASFSAKGRPASLRRSAFLLSSIRLRSKVISHPIGRSDDAVVLQPIDHCDDLGYSAHDLAPVRDDELAALLTILPRNDVHRKNQRPENCLSSSMLLDSYLRSSLTDRINN